MKLDRIATAVFAAVALTGCASMQVNTHHDPTVAFAQMGTFGFLSAESEATGPSGISNPLIAREIESSIRSHLASRGYAEADEPDLLIAFHAAVDEKLDVETVSTYYGYRRRGVWIEETEVREFEEGTLVIDIVSASRNELIWRGSGRSEVSDLRNEARRRDAIERAVEEILSRFPPTS